MRIASLAFVQCCHMAAGAAADSSVAQQHPRSSSPSQGRAERPHIMMVLGDGALWHSPITLTTAHAALICAAWVMRSDIGFANVGWNRAVPDREVQTPSLDTLVREGIQLTSFYAFKYCSPSRSGFLSGRNPIHVNVVNGQTTLLNPADPVSGYSGIPVNMTSIADKLTGAGYSAHAVGKVCGVTRHDMPAPPSVVLRYTLTD